LRLTKVEMQETGVFLRKLTWDCGTMTRTFSSPSALIWLGTISLK